MGCISSSQSDTPNNNQNNSLSSLPPHLSSINSLKISESLFIQETSGDPFDFYDKVITLGEGSYGRVIKVKKKGTNIYRAMKIINKQKLTLNSNKEQKLIKEISILKTLDHPNIMKVYEYFNTKKELNIISELCTGGELFTKLLQVKYFNERVASHIMQQLLSVVDCCHSKGIIHRDLKPENILIETEEEAKKEYFNIKVIDFGTGEIVANGAKCITKIGTPYYIAPEILGDKPYDSKCDLWSCGIILYILLSGTQPFKGHIDKELYANIKSKPVSFGRVQWRKVSENAKDLIKKLLEKNPLKRLNARQALEHPWIVEHRRKEEMMISKENIGKVVNNIQNFCAKEKLQQATLAYIVHHLLYNNKEVEMLREIFKRFDTRHSGRLTKEELIKGLSETLGEEEGRIQGERVMEIIDADVNGFIEYEEFIRAGIDKKSILTDENLQAVFSVFDMDKNGKISPLEVKNILGKEGNFDDDLWNKVISSCDLNLDGEISFGEFTKMMSLLLK